jgi:hypothetical protein
MRERGRAAASDVIGPLAATSVFPADEQALHAGARTVLD